MFTIQNIIEFFSGMLSLGLIAVPLMMCIYFLKRWLF